jgi:hypothetical protein
MVPAQSLHQHARQQFALWISSFHGIANFILACHLPHAILQPAFLVRKSW